MEYPKPEVGKTYKVSMNDCCVEGTFTAKLIGIERDDDTDFDDWGATRLHFGNGVRLDVFAQVTFDEVT